MIGLSDTRSWSGLNPFTPVTGQNEEFDYKGADEYRRGEADRYIDEINRANENDWFELIARYAETKSNDLATFPVFGNFIRQAG